MFVLMLDIGHLPLFVQIQQMANKDFDISCKLSLWEWLSQKGCLNIFILHDRMHSRI